MPTSVATDSITSQGIDNFSVPSLAATSANPALLRQAAEPVLTTTTSAAATTNAAVVVMLKVDGPPPVPTRLTVVRPSPNASRRCG